MSDTPSAALLLSLGVGLVGVGNPALAWGIAGAYAVGAIGCLVAADFIDAEDLQAPSSRTSLAHRSGSAPGRRVYG